MELEHSFTVPVGIDRAWEVLLDVETIAPCMPGAALDTVDGDDVHRHGQGQARPDRPDLQGQGRLHREGRRRAPGRHRRPGPGRPRQRHRGGQGHRDAESEGEASTKVVVVTDLAITGKPAQFGRGVMVDVGNKLIGQFADCLAGKLQEPARPLRRPRPTPARGARRGERGRRHAAAVGRGRRQRRPAPRSRRPRRPRRPRPVRRGGAHADRRRRTQARRERRVAGRRAPSAGTATGPRKVAPVAAPEPIDLMASAGPAVAKRLVPVAAAAVVAVVALLVWRRRR